MVTEMSARAKTSMMPPSAADAAPVQAGIAPAKFTELASALEDLLKRIADTEDPNIRRLRAKVRAELVAIQTSIYGLDSPSER
jgi:type VI protein secretion system component VasF